MTCDEKYFDIAVVGAGPAGLFTAINLLGTGKKIILLEKMIKPGRKLLLSGSGQCNLTHSGDISDFFGHYGDNGSFLKPALLNFTNKNLLDFFTLRGIQLSEREDGKIFPESMSSSDILNALNREFTGHNIAIKCNEPVKYISKMNSLYTITTATDVYSSEFLVLTTGGKSYPGTGSTGDGYNFARGLGHRIIEPKPALTPLKVKDYPFGDLSGISLRNITVTQYRNGKKLRSLTNDLLFTEDAISGPVVLNISRWIKKGDELKIKLLHNPKEEELDAFLKAEFASNGKQSVKTVLKKTGIPERLLEKILYLSKISSSKKCSFVTKDERSTLKNNLLGISLTAADTGDFKKAMATFGGVDINEINRKSMESKLVRKLYFAGEIIDVDGDTGGYNLQAAFSSAKLASDSIKNYLI